MYFPFFKPQTGGKRSAIQPQTIYSEFPKLLSYYYTDFLRRINRVMIKVSLNLPQGSDNSGKSRKKAHRKSGALWVNRCFPPEIYSTVTLFARFLGLSTSRPLATLT